jgi:hypothetical protein
MLTCCRLARRRLRTCGPGVVSCGEHSRKLPSSFSLLRPFKVLFATYQRPSIFSRRLAKRRLQSCGASVASYTRVLEKAFFFLFAFATIWIFTRNRDKNSKTNHLLTQAREEEIARLRRECRELRVRIAESEEEQEALLAELEGTPKGLPRTVYVRRVTDIVRQVKKQDADIAKVRADAVVERVP